MKNYSPAILLSNYPLRTVEDNVNYMQVKAYLKVIKKIDLNKVDTQDDTKKKINNPANWDETWFNNYE